MNALYNNVSKYKNMALEMPPLDVFILVKKSKYKIHNEAKVIALDAHEASQAEHVDNLMCEGFDQWLFVNDEDDYEWDARATARCE